MKSTTLTAKLYLISMAILLSACSNMGNRSTAMNNQDDQFAQLKNQQEASSRDKAQFEVQKNQSTTNTFALNGDSLLPPASKAGHCFARVFVPPVYENYQEQLLLNEASAKIQVIPAKFEMVEERVLVSEASQRIEAIPASYKWVTEEIMVKPKSSRMVEIPASYKMKTEQILVQPAHTIWKKGTGPLQRIDEATGEIMCLVEIPAQYKTVTSQVLDRPATTRLMEEPAIYKAIKKQVINKPASTRTISIPAQYTTVKVNQQISPAKEHRTEIPAKYQKVNKTKMTADGHMAWREVLCDTNMTGKRISEIQTSLKSKGFYTGPIDGIVGTRTMNAVNKFQTEKNLPVDRYLNVKTVEALGIELN